MEDKLESIKKVRLMVDEIMRYASQSELTSLIYYLSLEIEDIELMKKLTPILRDHRSSFTNEEKKSRIEV